MSGRGIERSAIKGKLRQQKILLDTALENMSQGLCMFDADGNITLFNERYAKMDHGFAGRMAQGSIPCSTYSSAGEGPVNLPVPGGVFRARGRRGAPRQIQHQNHGDSGWACASRGRSAHARWRLGRDFRGHHRLAKARRKSPTWRITMRLPAWQIAPNWSKNWRRCLPSFRRKVGAWPCILSISTASRRSMTL